MIRKARLTKKQLKSIHASHGHSNGGLVLYSVKDRRKVRVKNPMFIEHRNGNKHTIIAQGKHKGNNVSQVVKHRG